MVYSNLLKVHNFMITFNNKIFILLPYLCPTKVKRKLPAAPYISIAMVSSFYSIGKFKSYKNLKLEVY